MDGGVRVSRFRPPKPYAVRRLANRTHRKILVADGEVGLTGGVGIAEEWTGDAQDPDHWRDTHVRVRGPVVRGLFGAFAENWLEATGEVLVGDGYTPELEAVDDGGPMQVVRSSAGVGDTQRRGALLPRDRRGARVARPHRRLLRAAPGVLRRARGRGARAGCACACSCPGEHIDKAPGAGRRPRQLRRADRGRRRDPRVRPDDAAREGARARRRLVLGRLGQLRQPLLPAPRRGDAVRAVARVRREAHRAVRARPRGLGPASSPTGGRGAGRCSGAPRRR